MSYVKKVVFRMNSCVHAELQTQGWGAEGRNVLKFGLQVGCPLAMRVTKVMNGVTISARAYLRTSF